MVEIELTSEDEHRRARLANKYSPFRRYLILLLSLLISSILILFISNVEIPLSNRIFRSFIILVLVYFLLWGLSSLKYPTALGSTAHIYHVMYAKKINFQYIFSENGIIETTASDKKVFLYKNFKRYKNLHPEHVFVFTTNVIYLPKHAVVSGSISDFMSELNEHITDQTKPTPKGDTYS